MRVDYKQGKMGWVLDSIMQIRVAVKGHSCFFGYKKNALSLL